MKIDINETETSLLLAWETQIVIYDYSPEMGGLMKEVTEHHSLFFNIVDEILYVQEHVYEDGGTDHGVKSLLPQVAGLLLRTLSIDGVSELVEKFLDKHFPEVPFEPMTESESYDVMEIMRADDGLNDGQLHVVNLLLKIITISFPVFTSFSTGRLSDGFYGFRFFEERPRSYYHAKDYRELLTEAFGAYRKDLLKAMNDVPRRCIPDVLSWSNNFRGLLSIDIFVDVLRQAKFEEVFDERIFSTESLTGFPLSTIKRLFIDGFSEDFDSQIITDALEMAGDIPEQERKECNTWKKLHDKGMLYFLYDGETKTIDYPQEFKSFFDNANFSDVDMSLAFMQDTTDFITTGEIMNVCVGTRPYISQALKGTGFCFRLDDQNGNPYALVEVKRERIIENWYINQFRGLKNKHLPDTLKQKVQSELEKFITMESGNNAYSTN